MCFQGFVVLGGQAGSRIYQPVCRASLRTSAPCLRSFCLFRRQWRKALGRPKVSGQAGGVQSAGLRAHPGFSYRRWYMAQAWRGAQIPIFCGRRLLGTPGWLAQVLPAWWDGPAGVAAALVSQSLHPQLNVGAAKRTHTARRKACSAQEQRAFAVQCMFWVAGAFVVCFLVRWISKSVLSYTCSPSLFQGELAIATPP